MRCSTIKSDEVVQPLLIAEKRILLSSNTGLLILSITNSWLDAALFCGSDSVALQPHMTIRVKAAIGKRSQLFVTKQTFAFVVEF